MTDQCCRRYLCNDIIYTDREVGRLCKKKANAVNEYYDSGGEIKINGFKCERTFVTDTELMWLIGGSTGRSSIFCPIGIPIDLKEYNKMTNPEEKSDENSKPIMRTHMGRTK